VRYILYIFIFLAHVSLSQDNDSNPYFQWSNGEIAHVFGKWVNGYEYPDFNTTPIYHLKEGDSILILNKKEIVALVNGLKAPFCEVEFQDGQSYKKGFIWSGELGFKAENRTKDPDLLVLFTVSKIIEGKEKNKAAELFINCKIFSDNKLLASKEFKALGELGFYRNLNLYDNKGLKGIKNILNFDFRNYYNEGDYGSQIFFWDGKNISAVKDISNTDDPPCYYTEELIFPNDNRGKKGFILVKSMNGCNEGDQQIIEKTDKYIWKNNKLQLVSKSKTQSR